jgi:hemolysin III
MGMGWLVVVAAKPVFTHVPAMTLAWLLAGGLFYTAGIIFFASKRIPYSHAIWHLFVLVGSTCHYFAVLQSVLVSRV